MNDDDNNADGNTTATGNETMKWYI
jgi:hypothetical protein